VLGGLLSAYHLSSGDTLYLEKAVDLADRILPAFDSSSGLPQSMVNLGTGRGIPNADFPSLVSTAEVATLQLELRYLSYLTGNDVYWRKAENVRTSRDCQVISIITEVISGYANHQSCSFTSWPGLDIHEVSCLIISFCIA